MAYVYLTINLPRHCDSSGAEPSANPSEGPPLEVTVPGMVPGVPFSTGERDNTKMLETQTPPCALSDEERLAVQKYQLAALPRCKPMLVPVWLEEDLSVHDNLRYKVLDTSVVPIERCEATAALCYDGRRCGPTNSINTVVYVRYFNNSSTLETVQRELRKDLECACQ